MLTSIVGINWGDEGKGRMVDLLSEKQDVVVRYQGGNNAGHTVINDKGKFVLNLLPSAILREDKVNVMGNGMVVDIEHLCKEIAKLREGGIVITPQNLKISDKAVVCCPYNVAQDCLEEDRLGDKKFGSTRRGISPIYADKYMKKAIRMGDILHPEYLRSRLETIVEWKNLTIEGSYHAQGYTVEGLLEWFDKYGTPLKDYICDTGYYLDKALKAGKKRHARSTTRRIARHRFRHLSVHYKLVHNHGLRPCGSRHPQSQSGKRNRRYESVFNVRRRRPVHGRDVR